MYSRTDGGHISYGSFLNNTEVLHQIWDVFGRDHMKIWLIRHGATKGNAGGRYVGSTDEPLSGQGVRQMKELSEKLPEDVRKNISGVWVSPMKRCRQSAEILFPEAVLHEANGLRECDFGEFEYRNYEELNGRADYQAWIDSGGRAAFPGGESREIFCKRTVSAFDDIIGKYAEKIYAEKIPDDDMTAAIVCHAGTIMAVMEKYAVPHRDYFDWHTENGSGFSVTLDIRKWAARDRKLKNCRRL